MLHEFCDFIAFHADDDGTSIDDVSTGSWPEQIYEWWVEQEAKKDHKAKKKRND